MKRTFKRVMAAAVGAAAVFSLSSAVSAMEVIDLGNGRWSYIYNDAIINYPEEELKLPAEIPEVIKPTASGDTVSTDPTSKEYVADTLKSYCVVITGSELDKLYADYILPMFEQGKEAVLIDASASIYRVKHQGPPEVLKLALHPNGMVTFEFRGDIPAENVWLRYYRDEARTEEIASLADVNAGETIYYKVETAPGYVCSHIEINCPIIKKGVIYADIPGSEIEVKLSASLIGDVDHSGAVNAKDVTDCMRRLLGTTADYWTGYRPVDLNLDGKANAKDVIDLMKQLVGMKELPCDNNSYSHTKYLKAYALSIKTEGSDEVYEAPLPEALPTDYYADRLFEADVPYYGGRETGRSYAELPHDDYNGENKFWTGYGFAEIEMDIVEGDTMPVVRVRDVNGPYSGVLRPPMFYYDIPEGAKTVKATVRIAYLISPESNEYANRVTED